MRGIGAIVVTVFGLALSACASADNAAGPGQTDTNDPYEQTNRKIFELDQKLDRNVMLPVAQGYVSVVPEPAREGFHNFITNLDMPVTFANDLLQGEVTRAGETVERFGVNSTVGLAGLFDPATQFGIPNHSEDFGQTLGVWGVGEGPYIVLPLLGPDPPRDAFGQVVDIFLDPLTYVTIREHFYWSVAREYALIIDLRAQNIDTLAGIERSSVDYYASVRSLYRQVRNNEIRNGKPDTKDLPNF
jgi:phospholipid-binding lipoprotein MlaA